MNTCPEGWTETEYKKFKTGDDTSDSESDSDSDVNEPIEIKGYRGEKYKKILKVEDLLPE